MKYLTELRHFDRWLETNHLSAPAQLLWYRLMALNNRSGWTDWIAVDNRRVMALIGSGSEKSAIRARSELVAAGLLEYRRGKKGSPGRYRLLPIAEQETGAETEKTEGEPDGAADVASFLMRHYFGRDATPSDVERVADCVTEDGIVDRARLSRLEYAFRAASEADRRTWAYVYGVMETDSERRDGWEARRKETER